MLQLTDLTFTIDTEDDEIDLIHRASLQVAPGHFMAIVGPSGCGKTTLLKLIGGLNEETEGKIFWKGRDLLEEGDFSPSEIGYVPQFSIAYDHLTVYESIDSAVRLRVKTKSREESREIREEVMRITGLSEIRRNRVKVLSGGQKRRLGLAMELVSNPDLLLCDEVTSGLDPKSEREIVHLLHGIAKEKDRVVISVTHSLSNLELYDSVLVLYQGRVAYHGPPDSLSHYFSVEHAEEVYPRLGKRTADSWHHSWRKHADAYYKSFGDAFATTAVNSASSEDATKASDLIDSTQQPKTEKLPKPGAKSPSDEGERSQKKREKSKEEDDHKEEDMDDDGSDASGAQVPGRISQLIVLIERRWKIFLRDKVQLLLLVAMIVGFPLIVVLFGMDGVPQLEKLSKSQSGDVMAEISQQSEVAAQHLKVGSLISGLLMFQVVLLTLMGSNNSAREIAGERLIFEKEKFAGLHPSSYIASKLFFLVGLVIAQAVWMGVFVEYFVKGGLPGDLISRVLLLVLVNGAMTSLCLGISAWMKSPEQSSLLSIYLVGFQLPLSGAILALPSWGEPIIRPLISAFWAWSGSLDIAKSDGYHQAVNRVAENLVNYNTCILVLCIHILVGLLAAYFGAKRHAWE